mgnify:CR=1 FL=1
MPSIAMLDILIVLLIVAGTLNGLRIGAVRQLASLIILYISMILSTRFYRLLLPYVNRLLEGASSVIVEAVVFAVVLLLLFILLSILILGMVMTQRRRRRGRGYNWRVREDTTAQSLASALNHLGGIAVGFVTIGLWIGIGLLVYRFLLGSSWIEWEAHRQRLARDYEASILVRVFMNFLPYVLRTVEPWLPGGLPVMFQLG